MIACLWVFLPSNEHSTDLIESHLVILKVLGAVFLDVSVSWGILSCLLELAHTLQKWILRRLLSKSEMHKVMPVGSLVIDGGVKLRSFLKTVVTVT